MAVLINGNGNEAIYAQQDADWFASIMGNQTAITAIGSKFAATLEDANTIGVADGVIITQEGRRIQLDANEIDLFDIPAGGQGETNYYIIGYHLVTGDLSEQYCETFVRLMDNATDTIPEDTFRAGADEVFVSLYRVTQVNLAITDMELLLPEITTVAQLSNNLTELSNIPINTEIQIGTYNNKPLYRKVYTGNSISNTPIDSSFNISYIDQLVRVNGSIKRTYNGHTGIFQFPIGYTTAFYVGLFIDSDGLYIENFGTSLGTISEYIILLDYTKN